MEKSNKKFEFSKIIIIGAGIMNLIVIIFSCAIMWRTCDMTPLSYLIPSVAAEMAAGTGFYYSKARAENIIKLKKQYGIRIDHDDLNDT